VPPGDNRPVSLLLALLLVAPPPPARPAASGGCGTSYDCAAAQVSRREYAPAIATLERLLAGSPRDVKALNLLGIALTSAGRADEGSRRFRQALEIDPDFYPARKNLALNAFAGGDLTEARREFEAVLKQAPGDEVTHVYLGEIQFAAKDLSAAARHYDKAGARVGQNPSWTLHYAEALLAQGRRDAALGTLAALPEGDAGSRFEAGVLLGRAGAHAEAARFFAAARRGYQDPAAAGYNQVLMLTEAGDHEAALRAGQDLLADTAAPPARAELLNLLARAYAGADRVQEAYDALREATRLQPGSPENYVDLATICLEHHNYDLGLEIVDVGLRHRPDSWMLHVQRGVLRAMKAQMAEAEKDFDAARRLRPDDPVPYAALGMVWMQSGQPDKAVEILRAERARRKDHVVPYIFAVALMRSGVDPASPAASEAVDALRASIAANAGFAPAHAELGRILLKRGDLDGAVAELEKAVALDPQSAAALYNLAQAYQKKGDGPRAAEMAARVSRLNAQERDGDADLHRAMIRIVRESTAPSRSAADAVPDDVGLAAFRRAVELDRRGRLPESVAAYESALVRDPAHAQARYGLSIVAGKLGDVDGAIDLLREVTRAMPSLASAHYDLGLHLWNRHRNARGLRQAADLDEAERELRAAVALDAAQPRPRLVLGQLLAERQRLDEAVRELQEAQRLARGDPAYAYDLGLALRRQGDLEAAEAQFRAAVAGDPAHGAARRALGLVLRQKGDLDGALAELRRSVELLPGDAQGHNVLGTVLLRRDDLGGAVEAFRRAVGLDPSLTEAHVNLAQALARAGRPEEARAEAAEVARLTAAEAGLGRAMILAETAAGLLARGDAPAALAPLREAVEASPTFAEGHYLLGLALRRTGAPAAEAQPSFLRALELDPDHDRARLEVARLLAAQGEADSARLQLDRLRERRPGLVEARRERARLAAKAGDRETALAELQAAAVWRPADAELQQELAAARAGTPLR
jgi:tetratricopeptide (TPR) repeat protein